jgi:RES domain-containing protein
MDVDVTSISSMWFRHIPAGGDVYYRPDPPADNRWQHGHIVDALYFADSEETAWAEWYRAIAEFGIPPMQGLPRDLWRWEIALDEVADLSDEKRLQRVGLALPRPTRADWPPCQAVGEKLHADDYPALIAPAASRPEEGKVLCVFRETEKVAGMEPLPPPTTYDEPPRVRTGLRA